MIIKICKKSNIEVILSSFAYQRDLNDIDNKLERKYFKGLIEENKITLELSKKYEINYVDNYNLIPKHNNYFTDNRIEFCQSIKTKNLRLEDCFMEFNVAKCIDDSKHVAEGHFPIDVVKNDIGIDVMCVCLNGETTNEKSIMQNFKERGNSLDNLFRLFS